MINWLLLAGAIVTEVTASLALQAAQHSAVWYVLVATGYIVAFSLLGLLLRRGMPLGVAYGIWGAMGVALTAVFAALIFGQPLTFVMIIGLILIIGGVLTVEIGSQAATRKREASS